MKKYHMMRLYQVTKNKGYIQSGEKYTQIIAFRTPGDNYKVEAAYSIIDTDMKIMVERINSFLVKEVKTGIILPVVNFKTKNTPEGSSYYLYCTFSKVHTFVCSKEGILLSTEVASTSELEEYDRLHPDANEFKEELLEIIAAGKDAFDAKLTEEAHAKEQEKQNKKEEKELKRNEKIKSRRLMHQFKQTRR